MRFPGSLKERAFFWCRKILLALAGTACTAFGIAFNAAAGLGNDPVAVFYDGLRNALRLSPGRLGVAANLINYALMALVFLLDRRYVNIGTLLYTLPMGSLVDWGSAFYGALRLPGSLAWRILSACCGYFLLYFGISVFISLKIGVDPLTGLILVLRDRLRCSYRAVKIACDLAALAAGAALGGKFGAVTVLSAVLAGPLIERLTKAHQKSLLAWLKIGRPAPAAKKPMN